MTADRPDRTQVLYVDGDADVRERVRACLDDAGMAVLAASDREATLEALRTERVDCVVVGDGLAVAPLDLLDAVDTRWPWLPVVLYPAAGSEGLAARAIAAGAAGYQPRSAPDACEGLCATVMDALDRVDERQAPLDRMTDAFFAVDEDWRLTYLNDRGRAVLREAMPAEKHEAIEDLRGEVLWEAIPAAVETVFYERYHEALETQEAVTVEEYYEPLDTWFEVHAYPSPSGLSVYFTDVTDRRAYEQELEHRESVLTSMYRIIADADSTFEAKLDELFAIGREELGVTYATLSHVEDGEYTFEYVQAPDGDDAIQEGDVVPVSWTSCELAVTSRERLVVSDMTSAPAEVADREGNQQLGLACYLGTPVIIDGKVYGTFCFYGTEAREEPFSQWAVTLVDLMGNWTSYEFERREREAALTRERNRMEEFASVVSHDLRNPLNVAASNLELAREDCDSEYLDGVASGLDRMEALIEDVLALARLGGDVVEEESIEFPTLVRSAWSAVSEPSSRLEIEGDASTIHGDETKLRRLFENLLRNSVEHGEPDVTVRVGPLADGTGLYVADDGPGIPADERETDFERGHTTAEDGTGFGLAIVAEIVSAHGGEITVTESETGGARFEISGIKLRQ